MIGSIRYISLFSGIECASLAARTLGWEPIFFSEIEAFPSAVLAHHYPGVPNVGDMTRHKWRKYRGKCDVVIGGSPCQAFSVAGRRESLADRRGNLTLSFVEAVDQIDPAFTVWENVPGVLNTRDNAFGCFLAALAGCDSPIVPPRGQKWRGAGVVDGPGRSLAWRILDAQFFGVPQRRRRVFLIARRFGEKPHPAEILFERRGMFGDSPPRREAEEDVAGTLANGSGNRGWSNSVDHAASGYMQPVGAVSSKWSKGTGVPSSDECQNLVATITGRPYSDNESQESRLVAGTISADSFTGGAGCRPEGAAAGHFIPVVAGTVTGSLGYAGPDENDAARGMYIVGVDPACDETERSAATTHTLLGDGFDASEDGTGRGTPLTPVYAIKTSHTESNGCGIAEDTAYTLEGSGDAGQAVMFTQNQDGDVLTGDIAPSIGTNANATGRNTAKILYYGVRRLTPRECERLQGIPDDYTLIPYRGKPAADGPRYKAIGNGMAVPCVRWILDRIDKAMKEKAT